MSTPSTGEIALELEAHGFIKNSQTGVPVIVVPNATAAYNAAFTITESVYDITLTQNCTISLSGATNGIYQTLTLIIRQGAGGGFTPTLPTNINWPNNTPPVLNTTIGVADLFKFATPDGGNTYFGGAL